ncbi:MAG: chorismate mutase [Kineosporiaceae bacterium]
MTVRAIRGAVQVDADDPAQVVAATGELLAEVMAANSLSADDIVFLLFTATPDLTSQFPAAAVPGAGLAAVPRMCAVEMAVAGSLPRTVRLVVLAEGDPPRSAVRHVYLRGARVLASGPAAGTGDGDG